MKNTLSVSSHTPDALPLSQESVPDLSSQTGRDVQKILDAEFLTATKKSEITTWAQENNLGDEDWVMEVFDFSDPEKISVDILDLRGKKATDIPLGVQIGKLYIDDHQVRRAAQSDLEMIDFSKVDGNVTAKDKIYLYDHPFLKDSFLRERNVEILEMDSKGLVLQVGV